MANKQQQALPAWLLPVVAVVIALVVALTYGFNAKGGNERGLVAAAAGGERDDRNASLVKGEWPETMKETYRLENPSRDPLAANLVVPANGVIYRGEVASELEYWVEGPKSLRVNLLGGACERIWHMYKKETKDAVYLGVVRGYTERQVEDGLNCRSNGVFYTYTFQLDRPLDNRPVYALPRSEFGGENFVEPTRKEALIMGTVMSLPGGNAGVGCPVRIEGAIGSNEVRTGVDGTFTVAAKPGSEVKIKAECETPGGKKLRGERVVKVDAASNYYEQVWLEEK